MRWIGPEDLRIQPDDLRRVALLVLVCVVTALFVVDYARVPTENVAAGEVTSRTVKASHTFQYTDLARQQELTDHARAQVVPVYVHRADLTGQLQARVQQAFDIAREDLKARGEAGADPTDPAVRAEVVTTFRNELGVHVPDEDVTVLLEAAFPTQAAELSSTLLGRAMRGYIVADREELPSARNGLRVIELRGESRREFTLSDFTTILTPTEAREQVTLGLLESKHREPWVDAAAAIARASVRGNLAYDALQTRERSEAAAAAIPAAAITVKRGTILFRGGDVLTEADVEKYRMLQRSAPPHGPWLELLAVGFFLLLLLASLYQFGSSYLHDFSQKVRDVAACGGLLVLTALIARFVVASSEGIAAMIGLEAQASSVWFVVPVAGAVMLVRLLVGTSWSVMFAIAASVVCGLVMDLQALHIVFFLLSGLVAAGSVEGTRERMAIVRAGLFTGLVAAATVLLVHFLQLFVGDGEISLGTTMRPVWSMAFAFLGGVASAFLVLGLVPVFEAGGFVTDYRLMELANLNHPLLRQLMLRAPGSYHHSVIVGTLAEAACEAVGANALQARVSAYFHDIGKSLKPQYFVENQRASVNRHDTLDPFVSARVIISHVTDGGRMAKEHKLPKPIIDNIYMHHGTGLLYFFYTTAQDNAAEGEIVEEAQFRYPGPKPDTREAGIIMLADKVEAATRTIREPSEESFRAMIAQIINSVMADGQFEKCPLTFKEIHTIAETFVTVLLGIYHQRLEYPATRAISRGATQTPITPATPATAARSRAATVITLEIPSPLKATRGASPPADPVDPDADYESVKNLPGGS